MVLRELFAKLGLDVDAQSFAKGQLAVEAVKGGLQALVGAAMGAVHELANVAKETVEYASSINDSAQAVGLGAEALQEYHYAAGLAGLSSQELNQALVLLARTGKGGSGSLEERIGRIADELSAMPDGAEKTKKALEAFGRSGARMLPMLNEGAAGIARLRQEARELGIVLDEKTIKAGDDLGDAWDRLRNVSEGLRHAVGAALIPELKESAENAATWIREHRPLIQGVMTKALRVLVGVMKIAGKATSALVSAAEMLGRNWKIVSAILAGVAAGAIAANAGALVSMGLAAVRAAALGVVSAVRFAAAWALANAPFIAIGAAVTALFLLFDDIQTYKRGGKSLFGLWEKSIAEWLKPKADDPWWLRAIKQLVEYMAKALGIADKLGLAGDNAKNKTPAVPGEKATGGATPYVRGAPVQWNDADPNAWTSRTLRWFGVTDPSWVGRPEGSPTMNANIVVNAAPGQSPEQIGAVVDKKIRDFWGTSMEESLAAVGQ